MLFPDAISSLSEISLNIYSPQIHSHIKGVIFMKAQKNAFTFSCCVNAVQNGL